MNMVRSSGQPLSTRLTHAGVVPTQAFGLDLVGLLLKHSQNKLKFADIPLSSNRGSKPTVRERCISESTTLELLAPPHLLVKHSLADNYQTG